MRPWANILTPFKSPRVVEEIAPSEGTISLEEVASTSRVSAGLTDLKDL